MGLSAELLEQVLAGRKTIEARLRSGKFLVMRSGDTISFREDVWQNDRIVKSTPNKATVVITESLYFDTFADMLEAIDYRQAMPAAKSQAEALQTYRRFYTATQEREHGVVALRFELSPTSA
jgi:ASC-1-like (ASCH) protein